MKLRAQKGRDKTAWCHSVEEARTQAQMMGMDTYAVVNEAAFVVEIKLDDALYVPHRNQ